MSGETSSRPAWRRGGKAKGVVLLLAGVVISLLAVSNESYWIDEASTIHKAIEPGISEWWRAMRLEGTSNLQLPLYLFYAWGWEKLFGAGEWAMRAGNIPWFLLALFCARACFGGRASSTPFAVALFSTNAFAWQYLNEARPYAMQLGASMLVFSALHGLGRATDLTPARERAWMHGLAIGGIILSASGMIAMIWFGAALAAVVATSPRRTQEILLRYRIAGATSGAVLLAIGAYYLWTLSIGARATTAASSTTDFKNAFFILYELLGFSGLGPGRIAIRNQGLQAFVSFLPWLLAYGLLISVTLTAGWRQLRSEMPLRTVFFVCAALFCAALFLLAVGNVARFRVLGRHFTPLWPALMFPVGLGVARILEGKQVVGRLVIVGFLGLGLLSSLSIRFAPRHAKDDYRAAAAVARRALSEGKVVWWSAAEQAPQVYGVPVTSDLRDRNKAILVQSQPKGFAVRAAEPDMVFVSKPDLYDPEGAVADYLARNSFENVQTFQAFTVWQRSAN